MTQEEKLIYIAETESKVFEAGKQVGKQTEYDRFWDTYQAGGNRTEYANAFAGSGWTKEIFKPKHDIRPSSAYMLFRNSMIEGDMTQILKEQNVTFDLSNAEVLQYAFYQTKFTKLGKVDFSKASVTNSAFQYSSDVVEIEEFVSSENTVYTTNTFGSMTNLERINFTGVIAKNGLNVQWSKKLTHESLMSIINALQDKTGDTSGTSWVVTLGTENLAKLSDEEKLVATRKGWSLA